jgi:lipopolysaccharide/colanic/teichoic acid biosynthesis glycosyltransferase
MQTKQETRAPEHGLRSLPVVELPEEPVQVMAGLRRSLPAKAVADAVLGFCLLVLLAPVILLAALAVKLTSRGPAFYTQKRRGRGGRVFTIVKLRTMRHDCERHTGPQWARVADPRITSVGRFLRRTHLDELPQLVNVVRGDMSLVGPRPERPEIITELERRIPRYRERMAVRPGLTGLAQVQLPPDTDLASVQRKLTYDLYYIEHISLWLDFRLLLSTACLLAGLHYSGPKNCLRIPTGLTDCEGQIG